MAFAYTDLDNIKRIVSDTVRFSDSINILTPHDDNVGDIRLALSGITMDTAYSGFHRRLELRFTDAADATHYYVYRQSATEGSTEMILIDDGHTGADKTIVGIMDIASAGWSGSADLSRLPTAYDLIIIETDSHYSSDDLESLENSVAALLDEKLREKALITSVESNIPADLYFVQNPPVPRLIRESCAYLTCYRLIDDLFRAGRKFDYVRGREEPDELKIAWGWAKEGINNFVQYVRAREVQAGNAPQWYGAEPLSTSIGVSQVGEVDMETNEDYSTNTNNIFDLLDYYLGNPTSGTL